MVDNPITFYPLKQQIIFMKYNFRTRSLVTRAMVEARIIKWFKKSRKRNPSPSKLLTMMLKPKRVICLNLNREDRNKFIRMIREMYRTKKIIAKYRKKYGRRPRLFFEKVFGFSPRNFQSVRIIWNTFNIHFLFEKSDLISFWRKVKWGPGSGGFYPVGDTDIKIKELRGLVSFGRKEYSLIETTDIIRHESVHAFEDFIKKRKPPLSKKSFMFYRIKSELNAYLHNLKYSKKIKKRRLNEWARLGLGLEVKDIIEDYLSYSETVKRIRNMKSKIRKSKNKRYRKGLSKKLRKLKERLEQKRKRKKIFISFYIKTVNQIKKALKVMPLEVLQRIIYETPFERLYKKIPETVKVYRRMKYEWYNQ